VISFARVVLAQGKGQLDNPSVNREPGAPFGIIVPKHPIMSYDSFNSSRRLSALPYNSIIYTFNDIAVFSYFDNTSISIVSASKDTVASFALNADSFDTLSPGNGIYFISGSNPFAVLVGDAITSTSSGYFAIDENGSGTGTKFNTWMMGGDPVFDPRFVIFAYDTGTSVTVRDLATGDSLGGGRVDSTGYFDFPNVNSIQKRAIQVLSNNPVSVLSYTDQGYYVPSSNGTFAGNLFLGFSGYQPRLQNSITMVSYSDNNVVCVTDLTKRDTISIDTLSHWEVKSLPVSSDMFWKVSSTGTLTVANLPFEESWENNYPFYWYLDQVADSTGRNIGKSFIIPTTESYLTIFSYDDDNDVRITKFGGVTYPYNFSILVKDTTLPSGGACVFTSEVGDYIYRIQSSGRISVVQGNAGAGATFMMVNGTLATGAIPNKVLPSSFVLYQNFPNPFNPSTTISYQLPRTVHVTVKVYDVLGREMETLVDETKPAGRYEVEFNGSRCSSGIYFCRMIAGSFTATRKLLLLK
jgi:hypothetical protein